MLSKVKLVLFCFTLLLALGVAHSSQAQADPPPANTQAKIEPQLLKELQTKNTTDFFLWLTDQADLGRAAQLADKEARGQLVLDTLRQTAESSQQPLRAYLDTQGATYQPYYIANTILVQGGNRDLLLALAARDDVAHIYANRAFQLPEPIRSKTGPAQLEVIEPNLSFINADDVWGMGVTGENTVLAGNDTGLDWAHPAIVNQYRGWDGVTANHNYNWWDATGTYPSVPGDGHGHGTHTTGTMVGDDGATNQIGVAPGATTIHCKNLDDFGSGLDSWILTCFEWDLAPWDLSGNNPDPSKAPDAINNSWGYGGGNYTIFQTAIANLQAAGILVEASAGNDGPGCSTLGSPGDYGEILTTGSVNHAGGSLPGDLTMFSSRGPSLLSGDYLPDIMAPGENVRSSLPGDNYEYWSGTSMSGPHATALVGLMWSANPGLRGLIAETNAIIAQTAVPLTDQTGSNCGGDYTDGPNNDWGYGTINALAAVNAAIAYGDPGILTGTVTDASTTNPLADVTVTAALNQDLDWHRQTDANGVYSMLIFSGTYTVTAQLYGYLPATVPGVQITSFMTTTLDMALNPAPSYTVSGTVTDANTGWPLYARIDITGYPFGPVWTDPATGQYSINLAGGIDYIFNVTPWVAGYETAVRSIPNLSSSQTEDFALIADSFACNAPGYSPQFVYFEDFEANDGGYTVEGGFTSWEWGSPSSGPGAAHSGSNVWATNLSGNYFDGEFGYTASPDIDLSAYSGQSIVVTWWQWLQTESGFDYASVEVSNDGGFSWYTYYGWIDGSVSTSWQKQVISLDPSFATANFRVRFGLSTDGSVTYPGFYVDDVGIGTAAAVPSIYSQDFEANDGTFVAAGSNSSWAWGIPTRGPGAAHSGLNVWATNLDDNYNNNEDSSITSPDIDLSGYVGQLLQITWWQWLETEYNYDFINVEISNDGGATWNTLFGPISGPFYGYWGQYILELDSSYLVSNFRIRFNFTSDNTVSYPGFYLDDLVISTYTVEPPTLPCAAPSGGLVVGHVTDANTGEALNGAAVTGDAGNSTLSQATPLDTAVADGFYTLYSPAGSHTFTASKAKYGDDMQTVNVVAGTAVLQDFTLGAGLLVADPNNLSATLNMGETADLSLSLDNNGGLLADFKLREADQGMTPALLRHTGAALQRIPGLFTPAWLDNPSSPRPSPLASHPSVPPWMDITPFPTAIMDHVAAEYEGRVYVVGGVNDFGLLSSGYVYDPDTTTWTAIADMANARQKPSAAFVGDLLYVVGGWDFFGSPLPALEIYDPATDNWTTGATLPVPVAGAPAVALDDQLYIIGGCLDGFCTPTSNVYRYDVATDTWESVASYPEATSWQSCGAIEGQIYCAGGAGFNETDKTYSYDPGSDTWTQLADMVQTQWGSAFVAANGRLIISAGVTANFSILTNQTFTYDPATDTWTEDANANYAAYRTASACGFYKIGGVGSSFFPIADSELYPDLTDCGAASDVPWLFMTPITGTVGTSSSQAISVTLDASVPEVTQPGSYMAQIRVSNNTPYKTEPISVTMTVNAPADWGKVSGVVTGLARCDEPGLPLDSAVVAIGPTAVTDSDSSGSYTYWLANGTYTMTVAATGYVSQAMTVTVTAGQTTAQNVDLRLDAPCAMASPPAFDVTVSSGAVLTADLHLDNAGAADLTYNILETIYDLSTVTATLRSPAEAAGLFSAAAPVGPLSVQSLAGQIASLETPESNWFGGADIPGGVIRYAHAQCDEQPDSFYVISGVDGATFGVTGNTWRYDALDNTWTALAPMPTGQEGPTAVCHQNRIYVMGGAGTNQFYIYDITTDTWAAGASLPRGVWGAAAAAWDGKIYLVGGDSDFFIGGTSDEVNIYDIASDTWTGSGAAMPAAAVTPGYVQAGPHLYVVGGWNDLSPATNMTATQRYDLINNLWEGGPGLNEPRADLALAMTSEALYAIGGDAEGGFFFEPTTTVERLALADWSSGGWSDEIDQLPSAITAVHAGFCTAGFFPAQVWAVGGLSSSGITGGNRFLGRPSERCFSIYEDVPWLSETPVAGTVTADAHSSVTVTFDATNLAVGIYTATLVIPTNDVGAAQLFLPVTLTVTEGGPAQLFLPFVTKHD